MKKILLFVTGLIIITSYSCKTSKLTESGEKEKQFVATYLTYMDHEKGPRRTELMNGISPDYIKKNGIDKEKYKVNNYSIWGFNIESYNREDGIIVAKVWGEEKKWIHQLDFKVVMEKGNMYLMPSRFSDSYIDPWYNVSTYIKE